MPRSALPPELLGLIADRFKALGEPARLQILQTLLEGERTVTDLISATGLGQANVSKHLQLLFTAGFVVRRKAGLFVRYAIADDCVFTLCGLLGDHLRSETQARRTALRGTPHARVGTQTKSNVATTSAKPWSAARSPGSLPSSMAARGSAPRSSKRRMQS